MDPFDLIQEIEGLQARGFDLQGRLAISDRTHMVMRWHRALDAADEARRSQERKIGTTGRGIGPAYGSKMSRVGLRVGEMLSPRFLDQVRSGVEEANTILASRGAPTLDVQETVSAYTQAAETLKPYIADTVARDAGPCRQEHFNGRCAGTMLTSISEPIPLRHRPILRWRCLHGLGVSPRRIDRVVGVIGLHDARRRTAPHRIDRTPPASICARRVASWHDHRRPGVAAGRRGWPLLTWSTA